MDTSDIERRCLYWCTLKGKKQNHTLILQNLQEMLSHADLIVNNGDIPCEQLTLSVKTTEYIFCSAMDTDRVCAFLCDDKYYYIIDNKRYITQEANNREPVTTYKCNVWRDNSAIDILKLIPTNTRKFLNIKLYENQKFKDRKVTNLDNILTIDFIRKTEKEQVILWKKYTDERKNEETLDLSGFYLFDPKVIILTGCKYNYTTVLLNLNMKFETLNWLFYFPHLKVLSIWGLTIDDNSLKGIDKYASQLNTLELHNCYNITGRVITSVLKLKMIENLIIDNPTAIFHPEESLHHSCLTTKEWEQIPENHSMKKLVINSANLTRDYIKPLLLRLQTLENFVMQDTVMRQLEKNSSSGKYDHKIVFHSEDNLKTGFTRYTNVAVYDLVSDRCGPLFSDSMLNKIKEIDPSKKDIIEEIVRNREN
uniref:Uncharacterized protein n=1 Tax=viral metagenome TaxID=1070528 RepID=A0A6C0J4F1_9ZZZZ